MAVVPSVVGASTKSGHVSLEAWQVPAGIAAGDVLVAFTNANNGGGYGAITPPAGWTMNSFFTTTARVHAYSKIAAGSEGGSTFTNVSQGSTASWTSCCIAVRNSVGFVDTDIGQGSGTTQSPGVGGTVSFTSTLGNYQSFIDSLLTEERYLVVGGANTSDYNAFPATYGNPLATHAGSPESGTVVNEEGTSYNWQLFKKGDSYVPLNFTVGVDMAGIDGWGSHMDLAVFGPVAGSGWGVLIV